MLYFSYLKKNLKKEIFVSKKVVRRKETSIILRTLIELAVSIDVLPLYNKKRKSLYKKS